MGLAGQLPDLSSDDRRPATAHAVDGYGYGNPELASRGAYDHVMQALSGMTMLAGTEGDPPVKTGFPVIDAAI